MNRPPHIVVISTSFPNLGFQSGQEAAGSFVADFVLQLARLVRVTAVAPGDRNAVEHDGQLIIRRFTAPRQPLSLLKPANPAHWPAIITTLRGGRRTVEQVLRQEPVDHVLALWALPCGHWARAACRRHGIPYSTWALGSDIWTLGKIPMVRTVLRGVLRDARNRYADGYVLSEDVERISGMDCRFLPSSRLLSFEDRRAPASAAPYRLAFLGRWHPNKGTDLLIEALALLGEPDWTRIEEVRIFGGGPLEGLVTNGVERLRAAGRPVTVGGYLDQQAAAALYDWADYVLLPSRIESIPVVFSDTLQARRPILSTPIGDLPRLLNEFKVGLLADATNAQAYAEAMRRALDRSPQSFLESIDQAVATFDVQHTAARIRDELI